MICRGGIVEDGSRHWPVPLRGSSLPASRESFSSALHAPLDEIASAGARTSCRTIIAAILIVAAGLFLLPGRGTIAPLVESDYAYLLIAADRMHDGLGPTSLQPIAPRQPWDWRYDWGFLTQWPVGYPALIAAIRRVFHVPSLVVAKAVSIAACATALVGWFLWARRCLPLGVTSILLAATTAACAVPVNSLLNPSTDAILVAALPFVLLGIASALRGDACPAEPANPPRRILPLALAGLLAGGLCWFRYAAIFVPAGAALFLVARRLRKRIRRGDLWIFLASTSLPVVALAAINMRFGQSTSLGEGFNLGARLSWHGSGSLLGTAWWNLTDFGFFSHRPYVHGALALGPIGVLAFSLAVRSARREVARAFAVSSVALSSAMIASLLALLVLSTAIFGDKFNYVSLDRYYVPARPLFLVLALLPMMLVPRRVVRAGLALLLLACLSWVIQIDWARPYEKAIARQTLATPYGQWSRAFATDAAPLVSWLRNQASPSLVVFSNDHESIALETGIPTLPIPESPRQLDEWLDRIAAARGVARPRALFVLAENLPWRSYWVPSAAAIRETFRLSRSTAVPGVTTDVVFRYPQYPGVVEDGEPRASARAEVRNSTTSHSIPRSRRSVTRSRR